MSKFVSLIIFFSIIYNCYSQRSEEITIKTSGGNLVGEISLPEQKTNNIVLMIAGSGPTDKNGNSALMQNNCLKLLSDSLLCHNIATFRFDKRGVANSVFLNLKEEEVTIDTLVNDVVLWIALLKKNYSFDSIIIVGHSEGSLIGLLAMNQSPIPCKFISISGAGFPANTILKQQLQKQPEAIKNIAYTIIDSLSIGIKVKKVDYYLYSLFRPSIQPYLISWFQKTPASLIAEIKKPILILHGDSDLQVDTLDAYKLKENCVYCKLHILKNTNHVLKTVNSQEENQLSYSDPTFLLSKDLINLIQSFVFDK